MTHAFDREQHVARIIHSPSYRPAYQDPDFLALPELRAVRIQLELLKPEMILQDHEVRSTIVLFGSTRILDPVTAAKKVERAKARLADTPDDPRRQRALDKAERLLAKSRYYEVARHFARLVSAAGQQGTVPIRGQESQASAQERDHPPCPPEQSRQQDPPADWVVVTGGGPGIMEAGNRGAFDCGAKSIGLNIRLPLEQQPNPYITPELCFQFHYFAMRKLHFVLRAKALVVFPGGFGTFDELFEVLTLRQTRRMQPIPIILLGREYWQHAVDFQYLADEGTIDDEDLDLFRYAETAEEAWQMIREFHRV